MKQMQIEMSEKTSNVLSHVTKFVSALKDQLSDGWSITDVIGIVGSATTELAPVVEDMKSIGGEVADGPAFAKAVACGLIDIGYLFVPKKTEVAQLDSSVPAGGSASQTVQG